jgi:acetyl esterase/lipase
MIRALFFLFAVLLTRPAWADDTTADTTTPSQAPGTTMPARPAKGPHRGGESSFTIADIPKDLKVEDNVVYKTVNGQDLKLTVFYPQVKKYDKAPLLVYIHGGGWAAGNRFVVVKSGGIDVVRQLNNAGVVCATIEYRLVPRDPSTPNASTTMDAEADCRDAIHFLVKNAARFGIDPERIATMGGSAGGHLSLVTALGEDKDYPCDPALTPYQGKVLAEVADFPAVSLVDPALLGVGVFKRPGTLAMVLGGPPDQKRDVAEKLSPTLLLKPTSPPILLAQGDHDSALPVQNSITMAKLCEEKGVPVELIVVKGAEHGFRGKNIEPTIPEIAHRSADFLLKYLLPGAK